MLPCPAGLLKSPSLVDLSTMEKESTSHFQELRKIDNLNLSQAWWQTLRCRGRRNRRSSLTKIVNLRPAVLYENLFYKKEKKGKEFFFN